MTQDFAGRTALVTGGNSGIGRSVAEQLAARGAHVVVSGRDTNRGQQVLDTIRAAGGTADFVPADLTDLASVRALAKQAIDLGGGHVDVLVNNAGTYPFGPTADVPDADFDAVYAVNVRAPFYLVAELAPLMAARGSGAIVNLTTVVAYVGMAGMAAYGSSKAALELLTKAWAAEFGAAGVRVNAVSPGPTRTEGTAVMGENLDVLAGTTPLQRVGTPEEIAAGVVFLASDAASLIHGATLPIDGGRLAV
ncbi:NAD(P)-dependent dehydrogenase (short-subunit alcohol dehydrogenase family) [Kribbella aluminosa]|uniref:NAD(P)-dependent dehydrogenase (Short-subunit alcohol dehydrogenase family) n=1 Tax=Kribbella aluminosa TaxID=416017 RepID=A0ABS4UNC9_9ACTN|nr:SDR family oxidoreductase [Kribbella aluminosa]MBP2353110.1 NAD(P)-dependent dehydrogenase (short-subunit alcohol dehydrogenase family) [Kribbella aluminosa]